jgi:hypothetical protein
MTASHCTDFKRNQFIADSEEMTPFQAFKRVAVELRQLPRCVSLKGACTKREFVPGSLATLSDSYVDLRHATRASSSAAISRCKVVNSSTSLQFPVLIPLIATFSRISLLSFQYSAIHKIKLCFVQLRMSLESGISESRIALVQLRQGSLRHRCC